MVPSPVSFSRIGTIDFSLSSEYAAQFARGTWNWLTNVYTVGVGSICGRAAGTNITANTIKSRPAIRFFIIQSSWTLWQAAVQYLGTTFLVAQIADFAQGAGDAAFALL